ncbi:hypothetical protein D9619_002027 [Psilocybe cf. subviscida]|uniref:Carbonic anhydrase n=1 Tax=Psilocybe cf. subviscida TaxID=2480587 RepID=A0A8H5BFN8_9AGAR|nr:hypothetical protein D9619_002027 [Psilocybe cf. subviscida]
MGAVTTDMSQQQCEQCEQCQIHPTPPVPESQMNAQTELQWLEDGNKHFKDHINILHTGLFENTAAQPQRPPFLIIGCADSRASEATVFSMLPGTVFASRNIANQFHSSDTSTYSTLAYAVAGMNVNHVIVLGHYGCGGIEAAMKSPCPMPIDAAQGVVEAWVEPIRELIRNSDRSEIQLLRGEYAAGRVPIDIIIHQAAFRPLVEENVRASVVRIAASSVIVNHFARLRDPTNSKVHQGFCAEPPVEPTPVFIHGWVYDFADGNVYDLDVSVGPPGVHVPKSNFPKPPPSWI